MLNFNFRRNSWLICVLAVALFLIPSCSTVQYNEIGMGGNQHIVLSQKGGNQKVSYEVSSIHDSLIDLEKLKIENIIQNNQTVSNWINQNEIQNQIAVRSITHKKPSLKKDWSIESEKDSKLFDYREYVRSQRRATIFGILSASFALIGTLFELMPNVTRITRTLGVLWLILSFVFLLHFWANRKIFKRLSKEKDNPNVKKHPDPEHNILIQIARFGIPLCFLGFPFITILFTAFSRVKYGKTNNGKKATIYGLVGLFLSLVIFLAAGAGANAMR